jgi:hypothetical protein
MHVPINIRTFDTSSLSVPFLHITHLLMLQTENSIQLLFHWEVCCCGLLSSELWWNQFSISSRRKPEIIIPLTLYAIWTWKHLEIWCNKERDYIIIIILTGDTLISPETLPFVGIRFCPFFKLFRKIAKDDPLASSCLSAWLSLRSTIFLSVLVCVCVSVHIKLRPLPPH